MSDIQKLISNLDEQYQDIEWGNNIIRGKRECESRWNAIAKWIPKGVIFELGSAQGYFTKKMSDDPDRFVVSFEHEKASVDLQKAIMPGRTNVAICHTMLTSAHLQGWTEVPETIDCVVMLSILHHFPDPEATLEAVAKLSPRLIIEVPADGEDNACGDLARHWIDTAMKLNKYYEKVGLIGYGASHMNLGLLRPIYLCENPSMSKYLYKPYLAYDQVLPKTYHLKWKAGTWTVSGKPAIFGVNLDNLLQNGLTHPSAEYIQRQVRRAYAKYPNATDRRTWNVLLTPHGAEAIDTLDPFEELKPADSDFDKMDERIKSLMK